MGPDWARLDVMVFSETLLLRMVNAGVSVSESESESESSESEELEEVLELESEELLEEDVKDEDEDTARFLVLWFATIAFSENKVNFSSEPVNSQNIPSSSLFLFTPDTGVTLYLTLLEH
jgi:hypothetical protein